MPLQCSDIDVDARRAAMSDIVMATTIRASCSRICDSKYRDRANRGIDYHNDGVRTLGEILDAQHRVREGLVG